MSKLKMSPQELEAESIRLTALIAEASKAGLQAVKEMSKHPLSPEQMRQQVREHQQQASQGWNRTPIPSNGKKDS